LKNDTDLLFSVSITVAIISVLSIGSTAILQNTRAQVDCNANPNDPSCQQSSGSNNQQQQQTCPDGSQPDSNGNCPSQQQPQQQQPQQQHSTKDQICNALQVRNIAILAPLLVALHLITLGASTLTILGAAGAYCAS
jgi:hypothetical protein